jgi:hypothetical protein
VSRAATRTVVPRRPASPARRVVRAVDATARRPPPRDATRRDASRSRVAHCARALFSPTTTTARARANIAARRRESTLQIPSSIAHDARPTRDDAPRARHSTTTRAR